MIARLRRIARAETEATKAHASQAIAKAQDAIESNKRVAAAEAEEVLIARLTAAHGSLRAALAGEAGA